MNSCLEQKSDKLMEATLSTVYQAIVSTSGLPVAILGESRLLEQQELWEILHAAVLTRTSHILPSKVFNRWERMTFPYQQQIDKTLIGCRI